jgi:hypothetical protein
VRGNRLLLSSALPAADVNQNGAVSGLDVSLLVNDVLGNQLLPPCSTSAVCGDSACNGSETCSSCPADCGACPVRSVKLAWNLPTTNEDGSTLTDLAGCRIYYDTVDPVSKTRSTHVDVGKISEYALNGLASGYYFFAATAYDLGGNESGFSNQVSADLR